MMAKPAMAVPARAASTTLSGWRMCHAMRAASQDALSPLSTCSRAIAARSPASGVRAGSRRYAKTGPGIGRLSGCRSTRSGERVEHVLHVVVLLQAVDQGQNLGRLGFGKLGRHGADVFVLGREGRETARLEGFLQASEIGEGAADHELRLALLAGALAHLVQAMVDEVELQIVLVDPRRAQPEDAHLAEEEAHRSVRGEIATALGDDVAHRRDRAGGVIGRSRPAAPRRAAHKPRRAPGCSWWRRARPPA